MWLFLKGKATRGACFRGRSILVSLQAPVYPAARSMSMVGVENWETTGGARRTQQAGLDSMKGRRPSGGCHLTLREHRTVGRKLDGKRCGVELTGTKNRVTYPRAFPDVWTKRLPSEARFRASDARKSRSGCGRVNFHRHRRHCLCGPGSSPGKRPGDRHAVQKALL
jgi:hypothetical protein